jgi:hypothetical protein
MASGSPPKRRSESGMANRSEWLIPSVPAPRRDMSGAPKVVRQTAGNKGLAPIPPDARPLKGHVEPGSQSDGSEKFRAAPGERGY